MGSFWSLIGQLEVVQTVAAIVENITLIRQVFAGWAVFS